MNLPKKGLVENIDFYRNENDKIVLTQYYHIRRGYCCGKKCKHCPFEPRHIKGSKEVRLEE